MSGPNVTFNPNDVDGRVIYLATGGHVARWSLMQAQIARTRLDRAIREAEHHQTATDAYGAQMSAHDRRHLHALLGELGFKGDARFPVLSEILGREIGSTNDMDPADAGKAIDALRLEKQRRRTVAHREGS